MPTEEVSTGKFTFELGQDVSIKSSGETGTVIGRAEYLHTENSYFIRYCAAEAAHTRSGGARALWPPDRRSLTGTARRLHRPSDLDPAVSMSPPATTGSPDRSALGAHHADLSASKHRPCRL